MRSRLWGSLRELAVAGGRLESARDGNGDMKSFEELDGITCIKMYDQYLHTSTYARPPKPDANAFRSSHLIMHYPVPIPCAATHPFHPMLEYSHRTPCPQPALFSTPPPTPHTSADLTNTILRPHLRLTHIQPPNIPQFPDYSLRRLCSRERRFTRPIGPGGGARGGERCVFGSDRGGFRGSGSMGTGARGRPGML
jgi:hypothetical protein